MDPLRDHGRQSGDQIRHAIAPGHESHAPAGRSLFMSFRERSWVHPVGEDLELTPDAVRRLAFAAFDRDLLELRPHLRGQVQPGVDDCFHVALHDPPGLPRSDRSGESFHDCSRFPDPTLHGPVGEPHHPGYLGRDRPEHHVVHLDSSVPRCALRVRQSPRGGQGAQLTDLHSSELDPDVLNVRDDPLDGSGIRLIIGGFHRFRHTCTLAPTTDIQTPKITETTRYERHPE
ncbi:hypothetical protein QE428_001128 [Microbacterium sp. SORGH_AS 505]|nr:hypothetical protein [Microbacterium sp. SORGH_AS_0505]